MQAETERILPDAAWEGGHGIAATDIAAALGLPTPTPAQQRVIEAPPSPALVVAGAGSGKTETMAGRVVWLVANEHVRRDEILGLTFTRKAAGELAERIGARLALIDEFGRRGLLPHLRDIVRDGSLARIDQAASAAQRDAVRREVLDELATAYGTGWDPTAPRDASDLMIRPRVATYNAFADAIVREHAARIGRDPDAAMLSQSASWLIARHVVLRAQIPGLEDVDRALNGVVDAVQRLAAEVLDHRIELDDLQRVALDQAAAFEPYREKGEVDKATANLLAMPILVQLVRDYIAEKQRRGVLDFADQVGGAFEIVERAPQVREQLREQYRVVLLDEYQDTSVIQTRFLAELFRDARVMAVGDPHQSIYGWRGASADNLYAFDQAFAREVPAAHYSLMTSWRNDRRILAAANRVLRPLQGRGSFSVPELEPRPGAADGHVSSRFELTVDDEAAAVADWFAGLRATHDLDSTQNAAGAVKPHSGAILFRSKKHMQTFAKALGDRGIPHRILGLGGLLTTPEVTDVVSMLRVLHDPTAGSALIRLLVGPRFRIGVADMAALYDLAEKLAVRDGSLAPLSDELKARLRSSAGVDEAVSIVDALDFVRTTRDDYRLLEGITAAGRERMRDAGEMLARLRRAVGQPIPELIRLIELELRLDIELAANETRGPARIASTQLRAFVDEVRGFLSADERGTIGSLLAWLDKAESTDELMPRTEPPEPGVVQLLTIHGSKGLEWDAVAVVRMVEDELPSRVSDTSGWFGFGVAPFALRGDAAALPQFSWDPAGAMAEAGEDPAKRHKAALDSLAAGKTKAYPDGGALTRFKDAYRAYQQEEERRLAYVAVTRARGELLLTGAHWAGQKSPRKPSPYLLDMIDELGLDAIGEVDKDDNPYEGTALTRQWPLDPLGHRRSRVAEAAELVRRTTPTEPTLQAARLLAEREERGRGRPLVAPTRIPASRFKDYVSDFAGTVSQIDRPLPERPYTQTRIGTLFHQWVEQRSGIAGAGSSTDDALWESDEELWGDADLGAETEVSAEDEAALARLREIFLASEWAHRKPLEVETEIDFAMPGPHGEPGHIVICKLDAVYERDGRIEIVDWKTGKAPRTAAEKEQRMLQLALYRVAYHRRHGVPLDRIDVALFYVADDLVIRDDRIYSEEELVQRWNAARAERRASSASG
ncbi:ATP-dependent DNA helicase [Microbacterium sp. JZ31]|uniref:ATP-dependent DNA helicase n=1 Tax=Microbacterium sp. JZ31 TaxID=1906274 RepID=UPI00193482C9|nr:ATP-dependent DNA helicase [Microbacterium sp. JZ31]